MMTSGHKFPVFLTIRETIFNSAARVGFGLASYRQPMRAGYMKRILEIKKRRQMLLTPIEASQIVRLVEATSKLGGAMAEIGVFRGASARLIREADTARPLHLFDTFEGLPETIIDDTAHRQGVLEKGQFSCSLDTVTSYLVDCQNITFHKGVFPSTASDVAEQRFSFVHSDVDIYESTNAVLEFFYPRMVVGGVILTHDYASAEGVGKAFDGFFDGRQEPVIEMAGDQAIIVNLA